ncbi:hypothetical protein [Lysinibacillus sp. 54212]|uniref:hypothetical protein n=1 Tax=Lysinibacillus sp. 54212 TaxID=3119829 RepID=UPI002FC99710
MNIGLGWRKDCCGQRFDWIFGGMILEGVVIRTKACGMRTKGAAIRTNEEAMRTKGAGIRTKGSAMRT